MKINNFDHERRSRNCGDRWCEAGPGFFTVYEKGSGKMQRAV